MERIGSKIFKKQSIWILMAALLLIPAAWALFVPGFFGASDDIHIAWLYEFHKTIMMGQIPPRFVPDLSFGFGYPLFNFVFPIPFYLAETLYLLGFSLVDSIKLLFFITIPFSAVFMYFLLREFSSKSLSLAGAVLYIYTPYRAVDIYIRAAIGEIVAFVFLPLILFSIIRISKTQNFRWVGMGAISLAFLILSHNIAAYMFFPFLGLFVYMQFIFLTKKKQFLYKAILMIFLALLISIYFWLPAIMDSKLMKYDTVFDFADHFPTIKQLVTPYWGYGASVPGPYDGISFFLGVTNLLVLAVGAPMLVLFWKKYSLSQKTVLVWALISILSAFFLINHRSIFLWHNLPFLPYFQFPWRFLILTTFAFPLIVIALEKLDKDKLVSSTLIILTLLTVGNYFRPQDFLGRMDDYYLDRYIPIPSASEEYRKTQEEYLRLPKDTKIRPDRLYPDVFSDSKIKYSIDRLNPLDSIIKLSSPEDADINYNKYSFPGWVVKVDGKMTPIRTGEPFGQISFPISKGEHIIEISFKETTFKVFLDLLSLLFLIVSLVLIFRVSIKVKI